MVLILTHFLVPGLLLWYIKIGLYFFKDLQEFWINFLFIEMCFYIFFQFESCTSLSVFLSPETLGCNAAKWIIFHPKLQFFNFVLFLWLHYEVSTFPTLTSWSKIFPFLPFSVFVGLFCFVSRESYQVAQVGLELSQIAASASQVLSLLACITTLHSLKNINNSHTLNSSGICFRGCWGFVPPSFFSIWIISTASFSDLSLPLSSICNDSFVTCSCLCILDCPGEAGEVCGIRDKNPWLLFGRGRFWQLTDSF